MFGHNRDPYKNGWTKQDAIWGINSDGTRNHVSAGAPGAILWVRMDISRHIINDRKYQVYCWYSPLYSVGGSSNDATLRYQYCSIFSVEYFNCVRQQYHEETWTFCDCCLGLNANVYCLETPFSSVLLASALAFFNTRTDTCTCALHISALLCTLTVCV